MDLCHRIMVMVEGKVLAIGTPEEIRGQQASARRRVAPGLCVVLVRRPRPVGAGCVASLGRSGAERADCTAVLGLAARRGTRCAPCRRSAQTAATKVLTNALRAGRKPCAPRRPRGAPHPAPTGLGRRAFGGGGFRRSASGGFECCWLARVPKVLLHFATPERRGRRCPVVAISAARRGAQTPGRCAQRTSTSNSPRLSERSARRARSEFLGAPRRRAPQVRRRVQRPTASL
jgi:hypothetical protein